MQPFYEVEPPVGGRDREWIVSLGVFALPEGAVGDLAQPVAIVVQGADTQSISSGWVSKWSALRAARRPSIASPKEKTRRDKYVPPRGSDVCEAHNRTAPLRSECTLRASQRRTLDPERLAAEKAVLR